MSQAGPSTFVLVYLTGTGCSDAGQGGVPVTSCVQGQVLVFSRRHSVCGDGWLGAGCLAPCSLTHRTFIQTFPQKVEQHMLFA